MLKNVRAWALALATLAAAPIAHAGCASPTLTGLTGKDAGNATQTVSTVSQGGDQIPLHVDNGWNGTAYAPLNLDANCSLDVDILASVPLSIGGNLPAFATTPTFNFGNLNGAATASNQTSVQSAPGSSAGTALTIQGSASGVPVPFSASALPLPSGAATAANQTATQSAPGSSAGTAQTIQGSASGVPVPVSASALPLPTGAATAANQTAVQTAPGTNASTVVGVQGVTGGIALAAKPQDSGGGDATNPTAHSLKTSPVDSAGGDATDTTNHALNVTAPLTNVMLGTAQAYALASYGSTPAAYGVNTVLCSSASSCPAATMTFARGGAHITGFKIWLQDTGAWSQGSTFTIKTWSQNPSISGQDRSAYSASGSRYWTGDFSCTMRAADNDGVNGDCTSVGPTPDFHFGTLYYILIATNGSGAPSLLSPLAYVTPEGSQ